MCLAVAKPMLIVMQMVVEPCFNGLAATLARSRSAMRSASSVDVIGSYQVGLPQPGAQAVDDVLQGGIAHRMPVPIVDPLEVIDINHQEPKRLLRLAQTAQRLLT